MGLRVSDLRDIYGINSSQLINYTYPSDEEMEEVGVTGLFLGHYLPWDGLSNYLISQANGFKTFEGIVEGSIVNYENLDNYQTGIHDYFKFLKFGFGRATDIASLHIRRGRITRDEAKKIVLSNDGKFPWTYLGEELSSILNSIDLSVNEFISICDSFTNKSLFKKDNAGNLLKDKNGNLEKVNYDNQ